MSGVNNYLLGMDCGTTNIKAIIVGEDGSLVAEASRTSIALNPHEGWHEQDASMWWNNSVEIFKKLVEQAGAEAAGKIRGIAISSHTVSMLPVDAEGEPVRNGITYQDSRSGKELDYILEQVGQDRFVNIVGGQPAVAFLPNRILWYKKNEPENFARTRYFMQASSYINYKLTGVFSQDVDQATRTQCLDINTMKWSKEIGQVVGVDFDKYFPEIYQIDDIIGTVTAEAAQLTGLPEGIPVIAGCSDAMASMQATGMSKLGDAGESSGTSTLLFVGGSKKSAPDVPVVTRPCAITGMPYIFDAPIQTSGSAIKWFIDTMAAEEREYAKAHGIGIYDYLNQLALEAEPGCQGLFFFPYLIGERAPLWNDYARGMFIGVSMSMTRAELVRSVFEGTAYALKHVVETVKESGAQIDNLRICGGGAKSRTWAKIKASMLGVPVLLIDSKSGDVPVGDALILGRKLGIFTDMSEAVDRFIKVSEIIEPDPQWQAAYDKLYPYYVDMYKHLDSDLKNLRDTVNSLN